MLDKLCNQSLIPIYAVGGINAENIALFKDVFVAGVCMKSALMQKTNLKDYVKFCVKELNDENNLNL